MILLKKSEIIKSLFVVFGKLAHGREVKLDYIEILIKERE
jgi:hypothetical protein